MNNTKKSAPKDAIEIAILTLATSHPSESSAIFSEKELSAMAKRQGSPGLPEIFETLKEGLETAREQEASVATVLAAFQRPNLPPLPPRKGMDFGR